jgi:hypothetical protein
MLHKEAQDSLWKSRSRDLPDTFIHVLNGNRHCFTLDQYVGMGEASCSVENMSIVFIRGSNSIGD